MYNSKQNETKIFSIIIFLVCILVSVFVKIMIIKCKSGDVAFSDSMEAIFHLKSNHQFKEGGISIQCIINGCTKKYSYVFSIKRNLKKDHSEQLEELAVSSKVSF